MQCGHEIDWNDIKIIRAGVIPVTKIGDTILFAFGLDQKTRGLGDFGGHRELQDSDLLDSALREYHEECFSLFGKISRPQVMDCNVLKGDDTLEILYPVTYQPDLVNRFLVHIKGDSQHEVQHIVWITRDQLLLILDDKCQLFSMYYRIKETLLRYREYL